MILTSRFDGRERLRLFLTAVALAALVGMLLLPAQARAEEPFRLASQIEDRAGVLDDRRGEVEAAIEQLQADERVQLWVTYVDTFSGLRAQDWAHETADESDLGLRDALLAVAVEDRAYAYSVDQDFPLTQDQLDEVMTVAVEPALSENDWAGAVVGAATGMGQELRGEAVTTPDIQPGSSAGSGGFPWGLVLGLVGLAVVVGLAAVGLLVFVVVRRLRARRAAGPAGAAAPAISLDELRRKASSQLVETDDAVKTSSEELGFAVAQFGEEQAAPFELALSEARSELGEAFRLHKQFDDAADEQRQRELLTAVLEHTAAANEKLDAQAERFDKLRDLERNAPEVLAKLEEQLVQLAARLPRSKEDLAELAAVYAPSALKSVATNPEEAESRLVFAYEQVQAGREDLDAARRGDAAVAAGAAQEAAAQTQALLDAIGRLRRDLSEAGSHLEEAIAETRRDMAEAQAAGQAQLSPLIATAEAAVGAAADAASPQGGRDPLASLRHLEEADAALEKALQQVRDEQAQRVKAIATLERTLIAARAEIAAAGDYITTHRGAVGSDPRAMLAEAQRHLDQAVGLSASDPVTAVQHAASAHQLADRALSAAQGEIQQAMGTPRRSGAGRGGTVGGAVLGGILAGGMSGGGGSGGGSRGSGGGRRVSGGGGFSRPTFGGSGTRMRHGGGGRF